MNAFSSPNSDPWDTLIAELDLVAADGDSIAFWLRDDDAVSPSLPLQLLLDLATDSKVPILLAVIPESTGPDLVKMIGGYEDVIVAVHGWSHENHARKGDAKQEFPLTRPIEVVHSELSRGYRKIQDLYQARFFPMFVPPWMQIPYAAAAYLPVIGYQSISLFAGMRVGSLRHFNPCLDIVDWKNGRRCRVREEMISQLTILIRERRVRSCVEPIGILTHHLLNDKDSIQFLRELFGAIERHQGARWVSIGDVPAG
ncbi:hypothetical protein A6U97_27870 [Agrobacterium tumefaciens]|uniref:hypothetical protein n=1 Tax=Agrobacterium tumefaciens TaxID=358 RepID=UPI00080F9487|nr:hypothetical protein A6U97_27870 [Agrobacterium tumefaciens]